MMLCMLAMRNKGLKGNRSDWKVNETLHEAAVKWKEVKGHARKLRGKGDERTGGVASACKLTLSNPIWKGVPTQVLNQHRHSELWPSAVLSNIQIS